MRNRIDAKGEPLWHVENAQHQKAGIPVCTEGGVQRLPQIVPTDEAGAIVYWLDYREDFGDSTEECDLRTKT